MSEETTPSSANPAPAEPNSETKQPDHSKSESDIERLRKSKDEWKTKALETEKRLAELEKAQKERESKELEEQKRFQELAEQRKLENEQLQQKMAEREAELLKAGEKLTAYEQSQKDELTQLLSTLPEEAKALVDQSTSVEKQIAAAKAAQALLGKTKAYGGNPSFEKKDKTDVFSQDRPRMEDIIDAL